VQQEFGSSHHGGGKPAILAVTNAPEPLPDGDEIVTRRYEFYAYVGPTDPATHAALAKKVGTDGIHGINQYSNTVVVGDFLGAQMSAYKNQLPIGLTENIADGKTNTLYPTRTIVIAGAPFTCTNFGTLPAGMTFDRSTGQLYGTPTESGVFTFKVRVSGTNQPAIEHEYTFAVTTDNELLPPHSTVDIVSDPLDSGSTTGTGLYTNGVNATLSATPAAGYRFVCWKDHDAIVSSNAVYQFTVDLNHSLVATFASVPQLSMLADPGNTLVLSWPTNFTGFVLQKNSGLNTANWVSASDPVTVVGTNNQVTIGTVNDRGFFRLMKP
jgi:hypothetical protein